MNDNEVRLAIATALIAATGREVIVFAEEIASATEAIANAVLHSDSEDDRN